MRIVTETFHQLLGRECWGVSWEHQLNLSMHFGAPRLEIRQPYQSDSPSALVRRHASLRHVTVVGEWWLWALCARWRLRLRDDPPVTGSASGRRIHRALAQLDGQRIEAATVDPRTGATTLRFDLGGELSFRGSVCDAGELWSLYKPSGFVLAVRADGSFSHERATRPERWRALGASRPAT